MEVANASVGVLEASVEAAEKYFDASTSFYLQNKRVKTPGELRQFQHHHD